MTSLFFLADSQATRERPWPEPRLRTRPRPRPAASVPAPPPQPIKSGARRTERQARNWACSVPAQLRFASRKPVHDTPAVPSGALPRRPGPQGRRGSARPGGGERPRPGLSPARRGPSRSGNGRDARRAARGRPQGGAAAGRRTRPWGCCPRARR